jgi:hypothetical protein
MLPQILNNFKLSLKFVMGPLSDFLTRLETPGSYVFQKPLVRTRHSGYGRQVYGQRG